MNRTQLRSIFAVAAICMIAQIGSACSSLDPKSIPPKDQREEMAPLALTPGVEPLYIRGDIDRQQQCTTTYTANGPQTTCTPIPYHPMGAFLSNSLFLDIRGNLALDLASLIGLDKLKNYTLTQTIKGFFKDSVATTVRDGDVIKVKSPGLFSDSEHVTTLKGKGMLLQDGASIVVDDKGVRAVGIPEKTFLGLTISGPPPAVVAGPGTMDVAGRQITLKDNVMQIAKYLTITHKGKSLELEFKSFLFGSINKLRVVRAGNKLALLDDQEKHGMIIEWNDKQVTITRAPGGLAPMSVQTIFTKRGK